MWQKKPKTLRIVVDGTLGAGVSAKDVILAIIAKIGTAGATGHAIEYAGAAIRASRWKAASPCATCRSKRARAPAWSRRTTRRSSTSHGREFAPKGADWDARARVVAHAADATTAQLSIAKCGSTAHALEPTVTWGTSPEEALPVSGRIPDPARIDDRGQARARRAGAALHGTLTPGMRVTEIPIDRAFIGTCTNGRIEDLRAAAAVLKGRKAVVPGWVSPGSSPIKRQAEAEGLDRIFTEAGFEWRASGCSGCAAMNGDIVPAGMRCASTSNRNFEGRQGKGARTHLMSPAMVAAAAVTGHITDVRTLLSCCSVTACNDLHASETQACNPSPHDRRSPRRSISRTSTPTRSFRRGCCASCARRRKATSRISSTTCASTPKAASGRSSC